MRIFKGLENVHAIIDQHEAEWRRENGEEPLQPRPRVRAKAKNIERQVVERYSESLSPSAIESEKTKFDPERFSKSAQPQVKAINVIEQGDGEHHSWLYKEVMKAINDAAAGNKNVKIVAVFVPVIQNSKEFDNFPADETVTVSSAVNEDDVHDVKPEVNNANIVEDLIPPTHIESDSELTEAFQVMKENLDLNADSDTESEAEPKTEANSEDGLMIEASEAPDEIGELQEEPVIDHDQNEANLESLLSSSLSLLSSSISSIEAQEAQEAIKADSDPDTELEESAEPLPFDEINSEAELDPHEPEDLNADSDSELPDIPELESNPDEQTIELEEPAEADEPEEPDAGFPPPEEPEDDALLDESFTLDTESPEESVNLEPETVSESSEDSDSQDDSKTSESGRESESESESESEKLEDFGEIEII